MTMEMVAWQHFDDPTTHWTNDAKEQVRGCMSSKDDGVTPDAGFPHVYGMENEELASGDSNKFNRVLLGQPTKIEKHERHRSGWSSDSKQGRDAGVRTEPRLGLWMQGMTSETDRGAARAALMGEGKAVRRWTNRSVEEGRA
ncbi:hypothetical protein TRIUR3_30899 [Triticum urartu]|uniref:Uncharacterized protein n=1 Tax=Triticum urartu TaxID=4572 RepID=M8AHF9_TRIUA|nr:hypothetical protein TRIUR3_30899 [Triticum urartu]